MRKNEKGIQHLVETHPNRGHKGASTQAVNYKLVLSAAHYSAGKHRDQRRKGAIATPYINHPIEVAMLLSTVGKVENAELLAAALLHDILEDTKTTPKELAKHFGKRVLSITQEVTDDKSLPIEERKRLQIKHAPHISREAQQIKLADKISNVTGLIHDPPVKWSHKRRMEYLDWAEKVVDGIRGCNPALERLFDQRLKQARNKLHPCFP